ncbi:MAG: tetratricopeptide repeat protein [Chitinophagaceae bacterium]|jgi:tetratricopeptide (TPR) repeat protein
MKRWILYCTLTLAACQNSSVEAEKKSNKTKIENQDPQVAAFEKLLQQFPDSNEIRAQFVQYLDSTAQYPKALEQSAILLRSDSLNAGLWFFTAGLAEKAKDTGLAIKAYINSLKIYNKNPEALLYLAHLLAEQKNPSCLALCKELDQLRIGQPYYTHANFIRGLFYARTGKPEAAKQFFQSCINTDFRYTRAHLEMVFLDYDQGKYPEALAYITKVQPLIPTDPDLFYWRAKCEEQAGQKDAAIKHYEAALLIDPKMTQASEALDRLKK